MNLDKENNMLIKKDYLRIISICKKTLCIPVILTFFFILFSGLYSSNAQAATYCGNPGNDGAGTPSGIINTYYRGTANVSATATSIPVAYVSGSPAIGAGDLILIIQMQDADINYSNTNNYGSNSGTGSGYTNANQVGYYEFAIATGPVSGGYVNISQGLTYNYNTRNASGTNGQSTYQVIRVPQYSTATITGTVSALNWDGSVGGVVAMDVSGTLTSSGTITANGAGFRGGYGRSLADGSGANTDYRTSYSNKANGSKGEGIAGTPYYMNRPSSYNGAPVQVTGGSGYPNGTNSDYSYARGAPGNAGGGGTDADAVNNDENTGGGGGGNYAPGAKGGNSWSTNLALGGEGGGAVSGLAFNRIVMGGGGGAGTTNNGTSDNNTYPNNSALACSSTGGACSSGAPGGGIVIVRANTISGGTITANGGHAYNVLNDSGGGGGAGGTIVLYTYSGGTVTASVVGGDGGNAWRSQAPGTPYPGERHGPGGGGGGGFIAYSPSTLGITLSYSSGVNGTTTTANDSYGSATSSGGYSTFDAPAVPGVQPGPLCVPNLSTSTKTVSDINGGDTVAGDTLQYTITLTETNNIAAGSVSVSDTIDTNLTNVTPVSCGGGGTCTYSAPTFSCSGISVPASGSITIVYTADISGSATPGTTITNTANITVTDGTGGTAVAPVVTVAGTSTVTGTKRLYLYDSTSSPSWKLSRTENTTTTGNATISNGTSQVWSMNPVAASDITISDTISTTVPVRLYMRRATSNGNRDIRVDLQCSSGGTILTQTRTLNLNNTITGYNFALPLSGTLTCTQNNYWILTVSQTSGTNSTRIYPRSGGNISRVDLPATTVIHVDSISYYDATYSGGTLLSSVTTGRTVYIRAVVSDPFGSYDIVNVPTITIRNPGGTAIVNGVNMGTGPVYTDPGSPSLTSIYEYAFPVLSSYPTGNWSVSVRAYEGTEGTVYNTAYDTMQVVVPQPLLTILKSASTGTVNPGQTVTYTIVITNTGIGNAINAIVTDQVPPYTTYVANSTRLNSITVAGDGTTLPLTGGLLIDDNASRSAGAAAIGILPPYSAGPPEVGRATITYQVTVN